MFRTFFYGALLGSLAFAATETLAHAGTPKHPAPAYRKIRIKDVTRGQSAPELGFVVDILDFKDWKKLRNSVEQPSFSSLMDREEPVPQVSPEANGS